MNSTLFIIHTFIYLFIYSASRRHFVLSYYESIAIYGVNNSNDNFTKRYKNFNRAMFIVLY